MKNFESLAQQRRSVHNFVPGVKLSKPDFEKIIETTSFTPSGYNAQPWSFMLIQSDEALQEVHQLAYKQDHVLTAGNIVMVLGDVEFGVNEADRIVREWTEHRGFTKAQADALYASMNKDRETWKKREMMLRSCSLAAMSLMYAAEDMGYATCPMMGFRQLDLKRYLELPENLIPVMMIVVGRQSSEAPAKEDQRLPRKSVDELIYKII